MRKELTKEEFNRMLGLAIRARRNELGVSQEAVARTLGTAAQQVQKYEKGVNAMSAYQLAQFADTLRLPVAQLVARATGDKEQPVLSSRERKVLEATKCIRLLTDDLQDGLAVLLQKMVKAV